jgi:hypothetical protein
MPMTAAEVIAASHVPGTRSVFFLGCFDKRVTVFSQQVRALNLVAAILEQDMVRSDGRVAIVGAGAAGITAAVAFARGAPGLRAIDVYEADREVLHLQQTSGRYLHPHNYDWPAGTAVNQVAGLPILNWTAGAARDVQAHLVRQFDEAKQTSTIKLITEAFVEGVTPYRYSQARVDVRGSSGKSLDYDVVILAIGFGLERSAGTDTPSYWSSTGLEEAIIAPGPVDIFVSGNGDGGLIDFMTAAFNGLTHPEICRFLMAQNFGDALAEVEVVEQAAWVGGDAVDILAAYRDQVMNLVPPPVFANIRERLRDNVHVTLHTNEPHLFKRTSAILNRLGCALVLETDDQCHRNLLTTIVGAAFEGPPPMTGPIRIEGRAAMNPWKRFLRLGPDGDRNLAPFLALADDLPPAAKTQPLGYRPATPDMIEAAKARFGHLVAPAAPAVPATEGENEDLEVSRLRIDRVTPDLGVSGDLAPQDFGAAWRDGRSVVVDCALSPQDAPRLAIALARLCGHAATSMLFGRERRRWEEFLHGATSPRTLPGNLDFAFRVTEARELPGVDRATPMSSGGLADAIHLALDVEAFRALDGLLFDILGRPDPEPCGWEIEADLRRSLWALWEAWRQVLNADARVRRRFLVLLAHEQDFEGEADAALVRVGPRTLRAHLLKAAIFALAFVVGSESNVAPVADRPGNIRSEVLSGHACGVAWIEGKEVGPRTVLRAWTTSVVLLAELRTAVEVLRDEPRLDTFGQERPRIGDRIEADRPLLLGADERWLAAIERGIPSLTAYVQDVLRWRAEQAARLIEGEP